MPSKASRVLFGFAVAVLLLAGAGPGFRTAERLDEHYRKHGHEFGEISKAEYLRRAQELRDAPAGGPVLQAIKENGIITKFDRRTRSFGAYDRDGTIRTFFIPTDGERYFWRQARRGPSGHD